MKRKIEYFNLQQAFKISSLAQISSASLPATVRLGSAWYRPPDFLQLMYCRVGIFEFLNTLKIRPLRHLASF